MAAITFKVKKGEMFGGKGAAIFRPFRTKQSASETNGSTPEGQHKLTPSSASAPLDLQNLPFDPAVESMKAALLATSKKTQ